jgi:NADH-quinone oxidoreductase subunit J
MSAVLAALGVLAQALGQGAEAAADTAGSGTAEFVVFVIVAPISLGAAIAVVFLRNAVHAALMLVVNFFTIAVLYAMLEAQFLAVVQIIVYAGAIMVLFLFMLMLLGVDREIAFTDRLRGQKAAALLLGITLLGALVVGVAGNYLGRESACTGAVAEGDGPPCAGLAAVNQGEGGNVGGIGALLFTDYVWPFEVTSVLLVIAALGAMVLGRKQEDPRDLVDVQRGDRVPVPAGEQLPHQRQLEESLPQQDRPPASGATRAGTPEQ